MSVLLRQKCKIKKLSNISHKLGNPINKLVDIEEEDKEYKCLFDPYFPRSEEGARTPAYDSEIREVTFYIEFIDGIDNSMFIEFNNDTYNIQYVNEIYGRGPANIGAHLDIICYLVKNL